MLFANKKACFSPSVHPAYRKAWVKNGGSLTHTEREFYDAQYFFCDGMDDPWLSDLTSKRLIVRHPHWIAECVAEKYIMPIAPFTLDCRFEPGIVEFPEEVSQEFIETYKTPKQGGSGRTENGTKVYENIEPKNKTKSRKRPLEEEDTVERCRIAKRSRIRFLDSSPRTPAKRLESPLRGCRVRRHDGTCNRSSSPCPDNANAAMATTHISEDNCNDDPIFPTRTSISEHMAFWQDLIHRQEQPDGLLSLQVEDVLRAPAIESALFCPGVAYLGRPFHVKTRNGKSMFPTATGDSSASTLLTSNPKSSRQGQTLSRPAVPWIDLRTVAKGVMGSQKMSHMFRAKRLLGVGYHGIE